MRSSSDQGQVGHNEVWCSIDVENLCVSSGLLCDQELRVFLGHTVTKEAVNGNKPHLNT
jgi:hypothetical protein